MYRLLICCFIAVFFMSSGAVAVTQSVFIQKKVMPASATQEELQNLIQSVDLSGWSGVAYYLWTCTPRYFKLPMFDAKNKMKSAFDTFQKDKKILTLADATQIAATAARPLDEKMPGLSGIMCRMNIAVSNVKEPYYLHCLFTMLDARYLSRLLTDVANNSGKQELVPQETIDAIQKLLDANCQQSQNNDNILWRGEGFPN